MQSAIPAALMRGGTSRALIFKARDLPESVADQDRVLLAAMGSPDPYHRQTDGLGGGAASTSKIAILRPSSRPDIDVDYTFAQVDITRPLVDRAGNCGNISSAVGPFALDNGWVTPTPPLTQVRFQNTNTSKVIVAHVPTSPDGRFEPDGDYQIAGVAGSGSRIVLDFVDPGGSVTGAVLPTGRVMDQLALPDGSQIDVSIVDAGNPVAFVRFLDIGLNGDLSPEVVDSDQELLAKMETIRAAAAVAAGLATTPADATATLPSVPKLAFIGTPANYRQSDGVHRMANEVDVLVKSLSMGRMHRSFQLTAAICTGVAASIAGTLVEQASKTAGRNGSPVTLRLGHPSGVMELTASARLVDGVWHADTVSIGRTVRLLMAGQIFVPAKLLGHEVFEPSLVSR